MILHNFFMILYIYIAPGQEQTASSGQSFDVNRSDMSCHFIHLLQFSKKSIIKSDFIQIFNDLIHVYSPRAGADSPQGTEF